MTPGPSKLPPSLRLATGRTDHTDSGGRPVATGPLPYKLPERPDYVGGYGPTMWDFVVAELADKEVLRAVDAEALAACCVAYDRWRTAVEARRKDGITIMNRFNQPIRAPWVQVEEAAAKELQSWLREFGLTPSAAANLGDVPPANGHEEEDSNPFKWSLDD